MPEDKIPKIYNIRGCCKINKDKNNPLCWLFNGKIKLNEYGKEIYVEDFMEENKIELVEKMPIEVQNYINKNKYKEYSVC